jgi:hypothetical protein
MKLHFAIAQVLDFDHSILPIYEALFFVLPHDSVLEAINLHLTLAAVQTSP